MITISIPYIEPLTALTMVVCGIIGLLFSGEIILAILPFVGESKERKKYLKWLDVIMGCIAAVVLTLLIADETANFRWLTVLLFVAFMIVTFAHPAKEFQGWEMILLAVPFIFVTIVAFWLHSNRQFLLFGAEIPLWLILGIVALIMLIIFLVVFFVEETFVDPILYFLGWAPLVFVVCALVLIQGILLFVFPVNGALHFIG